MKWTHVIFKYFIVIYPALLSGLAQAADVRGIVLRASITVEGESEIRRYRDIAVAADDSTVDSKACNPGNYSVIWLSSDRMPSAAPLSDTLEMVQHYKTFKPCVMAVTVNSTISFPNYDPFFHNVFSYSKTKQFDLGKYKEGKTKYVTFTKPGIVPVFCEIHYSMRAYIHVLESPFFAVSDEKGRFKIGNVPEGEYRVEVWQEGQPNIKGNITVDADTNWVELR